MPSEWMLCVVFPFCVLLTEHGNHPKQFSSQLSFGFVKSLRPQSWFSWQMTEHLYQPNSSTSTYSTLSPSFYQQLALQQATAYTAEFFELAFNLPQTPNLSFTHTHTSLTTHRCTHTHTHTHTHTSILGENFCIAFITLKK